MEHNLDDSLNLESAMGVDFEHGEDTVVNQEDITLEPSGEDDSIPMEFQHIEEQPMLMDTGNEEIIDFMGEQFTLQEYSIEDDQVSHTTTTMEANQQNENILTSKAEPTELVTMAEESYTCVFVSSSGEISKEPKKQPVPKIINIKSTSAVPKKETKIVSKSVVPRQVAIAPKPTRVAQVLAPMKQFAIAPKPVTLIKKIGAGEQTGKGNTVLAQLGSGKQLVMVPHKIKVMTAGGGPIRLLSGDSDQAQLIPNQTANQGQNKVMAKVIVQGSSNDLMSNQPAVITKILPTSSSGATQTRYVNIQQKSVPISISNNKVIVSSPSKFGKKQLIAIKSPSPKLLPAPVSQGTSTKKVVITANPTQNVILKTAGPAKTGQITKTLGQRTQLHQINVPGKGIQLIRLVTNPAGAGAGKSAAKPAPAPAPGSGTQNKTFVLTDAKGNLIHMTAEKVSSSAPPPLIVTSGIANKAPTKKLVRIAPVTSKASQQQTMQQQSRVSGQSLLAPLSPVAPVAPAPAPSLGSVDDMLAAPSGPTGAGDVTQHDLDVVTEEVVEPSIIKREEVDSKTALQALIADTVGSDADVSADSRMDNYEDSQQSVPGDESREQAGAGAPPVIVIPSTYMKSEMLAATDDHSSYNFEMNNEENRNAYKMSFQEDQRLDGSVNVEVDYAYHSPDNSLLVENDAMNRELALRARKACNCTKSQCLKLYCDCFANGEFCHRCNCTNCHNNLANEELRQKAIRGCLDRNPNAFRPKIGKTKAGGPDIIRRHNKGCNCKRSGCLKNYCECYEAKIACTSICKCVGCRNVEETLERRRRSPPAPRAHLAPLTPRARAPPSKPAAPAKQPCSFMTSEVIDAVCQCLLTAAVRGGEGGAGGQGGPAGSGGGGEALRDVLEEFALCLHDIISASHHSAAAPLHRRDEPQHV